MCYAGNMKLLNIAVATALVLGTSAVVAPSEAAAQTTVKVSDSKRKIKSSRAYSMARKYLGVPYRYGGSTPRGFDCSGYTQYVYNKIGVELPRRASQQRRAVKYVRHPRPGDLTFFHSGGRVYHVGIYAGGHHVYHAPRPGSRVRKERIWTRSVTYGRP